MGDKELHKKVRNAIFLAALGSWEESCTFEELSDDGKKVYEGYATAAMEVYREELEKLRAQVHEMAANIEAAVGQATAMEHAGALAIVALRGVADNEALTAEQHASVAAAILAMLDAKPRWAVAETGRISPNSEGTA